MTGYIWVAWCNLSLGFSSCSQECWELEIILKAEIISTVYLIIFRRTHHTIIQQRCLDWPMFVMISVCKIGSYLCKCCQPWPKVNPLWGCLSVLVPATQYNEKIYCINHDNNCLYVARQGNKKGTHTFCPIGKESTEESGDKAKNSHRKATKYSNLLWQVGWL